MVRTRTTVGLSAALVDRLNNVVESNGNIQAVLGQGSMSRIDDLISIELAAGESTLFVLP